MNDISGFTGSPCVSLVVPVYKAAAYLTDCVESILAQSFEDYEVLLIDDGSPDECPVICDRLAARDSRIRVVHKRNGGVSSARNLGIELARGKYIVFVDSDDLIAPDYLLDLVQAAEIHGDNRTLVIADYQPFSEEGQEERKFPQPFTAHLVPGGMDTRQFRDLIFGFILFPPYCKLYRSDVIRHLALCFNTEIRTAEDFDFNRHYLEGVDRVCYIPSVHYQYRVGYKRYVPSNHGVLGQSEIKSAHIMANGIVSLAKKLDLMSQLDPEICLWAARKHYFNRLPMLFAESREVIVLERYRLYRQLTADPVYRSAHRRGIRFMEKSTTRLIAERFDCFVGWWLFYKFVHFRRSFRVENTLCKNKNLQR